MFRMHAVATDNKTKWEWLSSRRVGVDTEMEGRDKQSAEVERKALYNSQPYSTSLFILSE